ncbi:hypothetical protein D3C79_919350 [compost metagenome]
MAATHLRKATLESTSAWLTGFLRLGSSSMISFRRASIGCQSPTASATSPATDFSSAARASICSSEVRWSISMRKAVSTEVCSAVLSSSRMALILPSPLRMRCSGWCSIMWAVMLRRLRAMRMESTRKGVSCRMISTMVWGDCHPWRVSSGL